MCGFGERRPSPRASTGAAGARGAKQTSSSPEGGRDAQPPAALYNAWRPHGHATMSKQTRPCPFWPSLGAQIGPIPSRVSTSTRCIPRGAHVMPRGVRHATRASGTMRGVTASFASSGRGICSANNGPEVPKTHTHTWSTMRAARIGLTENSDVDETRGASGPFVLRRSRNLWTQADPAAYARPLPIPARPKPTTSCAGQ